MAQGGYVYVFLHIPKCGGTTIIRHLRRHLRWDEEFIHLGGWGNNYRRRLGRADLLSRTPEERHQVRVLAGHQARFGIHEQVGRQPRYFTILRDPADRILSAYNFRMQMEGLDTSFDGWYANYPRNNAFKWLRNGLNLQGATAFDDTIWAIRRMWWIGLTEHLSKDLPYLFRALGAPSKWTNQRTAVLDKDELIGNKQAASSDESKQAWVYGKKIYKRLELTDALRDRLHEDNGRDRKLYTIGQRLRTRKLHKLHNVGSVPAN